MRKTTTDDATTNKSHRNKALGIGVLPNDKTFIHN